MPFPAKLNLKLAQLTQLSELVGIIERRADHRKLPGGAESHAPTSPVVGAGSVTLTDLDNGEIGQPGHAAGFRYVNTSDGAGYRQGLFWAIYDEL